MILDFIAWYYICKYKLFKAMPRNAIIPHPMHRSYANIFLSSTPLHIGSKDSSTTEHGRSTDSTRLVRRTSS
jgi:hypothetical protein